MNNHVKMYSNVAEYVYCLWVDTIGTYFPFYNHIKSIVIGS